MLRPAALSAISIPGTSAYGRGSPSAPSRAVLDLVARGDPGIQPAVQRAHFGVAQADQFFRDLRRRSFVGTGAVENHLAIGGQLLEAPFHFVELHRQRAGNETPV